MKDRQSAFLDSLTLTSEGTKNENSMLFHGSCNIYGVNCDALIVLG